MSIRFGDGVVAPRAQPVHTRDGCSHLSSKWRGTTLEGARIPRELESKGSGGDRDDANIFRFLCLHRWIDYGEPESLKEDRLYFCDISGDAEGC